MIFRGLLLLVALSSQSLTAAPVELIEYSDGSANQMVLQLPGQQDADLALGLGNNNKLQFFANGFPTNFRKSPSGKVDIRDFPRQSHWLTKRYVNGIMDVVGDYHTVMPVYLPLTGPLDMAALPKSAADYTRLNAPIQLVDIDPNSAEYGRRFPLHVTQMEWEDSYRPEHLLQVNATFGLALRPNTTYALVVTEQAPLPKGKRWVQNPLLNGLLAPQNSTWAIEPSLTQQFAPLRQFLARYGVDSQFVVAATVWTTGDPLAQFYQGAARVSEKAQQLASLPITTLETYLDYPEYCVIRAFLDVPGFQTGQPPYTFTGGAVEWDSSGAPIEQYQRQAEIVLTIPKQGTMPASGYPVMSYVHGAGGRAHQVHDRGEFSHIALTYPYYIGKEGQGPSQIAAERGWASAAMAGHLAVDHIGQIRSLAGAMDYNPYNPVGLRGVYQTMAWERIYFRRIMEQIQVPANLCPDADPGVGNSAFAFDPNMQVNLGQSQGSWVAALAVAADPIPYQGVIASGSAGSWTKLLSNSMSFELAMNLGVINRLGSLLKIDDAHPFMMLMEWLLGTVDSAVNIEQLMVYSEKTRPHFIAFSGFQDYFLREPAQRPFYIAARSDLAGQDIGRMFNYTLMPHISVSGAEQLSLPVTANYSSPGRPPVTNTVTRHRVSNPVLFFNGHETLFQNERAKHRYGCFLEDIAKQRTPVIFKGSRQGDPCSD